ncbi:MAG: metal transporter [Candidatus Firestonebacteria bacterium RIFOXYC2_FULL_39_67]|nr:MAG: metal transporter [Candidatus Firestonebacteria bacterium RIFOXYC2_FULL_39_67]
MNKFLTLILQQRFMVICITLILLAGGIAAWRNLPVDAFPDVTNTQVMIITQAPGLAPVEVERLISTPLEREMNGLPDVTMVRSLSKAGLSQVVVIFEDNANIYFARQIVFERLQAAKENLPQGFDPELGPISTGLGEIYQYTLEGKNVDLTELRTVQDWIIRPQLRSIPGVTEVNSFGGFAKQYQVIVDPDKLVKYGLTLRIITEALRNNNSTAPANYIVKGEEQIVVRGDGLARSLNDIANIVVAANDGSSVYIRDVAEVQIGHEIRWGAATRDGKGETVVGMAVMLKDADSKIVVDKVKLEIKKIEERLPNGIKIKPFYDRTDLIKACINTVVKALLEGGVLVIIVLFLFLGDFRAASVVCLALPLSALITFIMMKWFGLTANLMSLGGLVVAMGMIVDASIVVVENIFRHLSEKKLRSAGDKVYVCLNATAEVARPVFFAILITIITKVPLFALQAIEGKMFKPMALTLIFAMAGSLLVSLTIIPVVSSYLIKGKAKDEENAIIRRIKGMYLPVLHTAMRFKKITIGTALVIFIISVYLVKFVGTEFLPYLDEGSIVINVTKYPTVSLDESKRIGTQIEELLLKFPEVDTVVTKTGRAEIAEDPMGPEQNDVFVTLKERKYWKAKSKIELVAGMDEELSKLRGIKLGFSQPIALRVNELISGIKSDVAVKLFGYDLALLAQKAEEIERVLAGISGANDVKVEQVGGFLQLDIKIDRLAIARYGINVGDVNEIIETAVGGKTVSTIYEEDRRFNLAVRFPVTRRNSEKAIQNILITSPQGQRVPLGQLAKINLIEAPNQISRENGMRRVVIEANVRGRDIGSFVAEAQSKTKNIETSLPPGYFIGWGGQFENQQRAMKTLRIVVPIVIFAIFIMLFMTFGSLRPAALVIMNLPFSWVGGILTVFLFNITLSVSAVVGFITLFGIAVANGTVLVAFFIQLRHEGMALKEAVIKGCEVRLRPLLMTSLTAVLGLIPVLLASGPGAEIQKPLAAVVMGGLVTSFFLTMVVLPVLYSWFEKEKTEF